MLTALLLCLGFSALCVYVIYAENLLHRPSPQFYLLLLGVGMCVGTTSLSHWVQGIENLLRLTCSLRDHLSLGVGMCRGATSLYFWVRPGDIGCTLPENFVCLLILALYMVCYGSLVGEDLT